MNKRKFFGLSFGGLAASALSSIGLGKALDNELPPGNVRPGRSDYWLEERLTARISGGKEISVEFHYLDGRLCVRQITIKGTDLSYFNGLDIVDEKK